MIRRAAWGALCGLAFLFCVVGLIAGVLNLVGG